MPFSTVACMRKERTESSVTHRRRISSVERAAIKVNLEKIRLSWRHSASAFSILLALVFFFGCPNDNVFAQSDPSTPGIAEGSNIPPLEARDQDGRLETFESLKGPNGLLVLFSRSADWCPYCKMNLLQLQQAKARFEDKGIHVASVTYDSEAILKNFSLRKGITYPMLSDVGSKIIREFGILNPEGTGMAAGIPYPGFYLISPAGRIERRFFEAQFTDRFTRNDIYAELFGVPPTGSNQSPLLKTPHVSFEVSQSDEEAGAGSRIKLLIKIVPAEHVHLYAPGAEKNGYRPAKLILDDSSQFRVAKTHYPAGEPFTFEALKETVPVYNKPFLLTQDVALAASKDFQSGVGSGTTVHIAGKLLYQACNDHICFNRAEQAVNWDVPVPRDPGHVRSSRTAG